MRSKLDALMKVTTAFLKSRARDLALTPDMISSIKPWRDAIPATLPMLSLLPAIQSRASRETDEVTNRLITAASVLPWRQTYDEADGFDRRFLDTYGWTDLAGPEGPYRADGFRLMAGYWGQGLVYPDHSHPPDEDYIVLAGSAWFALNDDPLRKLGPGEIFHVPSRTVHSAEMRDEGLLALAIWRAEDVSVRINLTESDRNVSMN